MSLSLGLKTVLGLCLAATAFSCRKVEKSETKSLDNFTRAEGEALKRNSCSGSFGAYVGIHKEWDFVKFDEKSNISEADQKALISQVEKSLTAIPPRLQEIVFVMGTSIRFSKDLNRKRTNAPEDQELLTCVDGPADYRFLSEGTGKAEGCWVVDPKTNDFVILMNPTVDSVNHALVRTFGYLLSQVLTRLDMDASGKVRKTENKAFDALMNKVAMALINDVDASKGKLSLTRYKDKIDTSEFKHFAFAEAFDSFYCSGNNLVENDSGPTSGNQDSSTSKNTSFSLSNDQSSFAVMSRSFPKTLAVMKVVHEELLEISFDESVKPDSKALGLAGDDSLIQIQSGEQSAGFIFRALAGGIGRVGAGLFRGVGAIGRVAARGVGAIGRGVVNVGRGIFNGGRAVLGGAARGIGAMFPNFRPFGGAFRLDQSGVAVPEYVIPVFDVAPASPPVTIPN